MQTRNFFLGAVIGSLLGFTGFGHPNSSALAEDVPCQTTRPRDLTPEQAASLEKKLERGRNKLEKWSILVQAGLEPDFGGNLRY